jgi:hypothetical protein
LIQQITVGENAVEAILLRVLDFTCGFAIPRCSRLSDINLMTEKL